MRAGEVSAADDLLSEAVAAGRDVLGSNPATLGLMMARYGESLLQLGQPVAAEVQLVEALSLLENESVSEDDILNKVRAQLEEINQIKQRSD